MSNKDYTKYDLIFIKENRKLLGLAKTKLPLETFKYLLEKDLLTPKHLQIFYKNSFGRTWVSNLGDLLINNPNDSKRFTEFDVRGTKYYACNQWEIGTITNFINYINNEFCDYIEIRKSQHNKETIDWESFNFELGE